MKWLLLTGATGFVGRNFLLKMLREAQYTKIFVPVRSPEKLRIQLAGDGFDSIPPQVIPIESSARSWKLKDHEVGNAPSDVTLHVVHCAGVNFGRNQQDYVTVNVEGTKSLFAELKRVDAALVLSSQAASGPCEGVSEKDESHPDSPVTWYGVSKCGLERAAIDSGAKRVLILRPPMILGPRDTASLPLFKMAKAIVRVKPGRKDKFFSFISVGDLCEAMATALKQEDRWAGQRGQKYFIASSEVFSDRALISTAARVSQRQGVTITIPQGVIRLASLALDKIPPLRDKVPTLSIDRVKDIWPDRWVVSPKAFEKDFSWKAKDSLEQTLTQTLQWYRKTGQIR